MVKYFRVALLWAILGMWGTAYSAEPGPEPEVVAQEEREFVPVTDEMLLNPDPADWLMVHRTYDLTGYSPLDQINQSNVGQLKLAWMRAMDVGPQELRPLIYDGIMLLLKAYAPELEAPLGSNMMVVFALPK